MKSTAFLIFASILLVFVYLLTMHISPTERGGEMAICVPRDALLFLEQQNGAEAVKRFAASRLGRQLESIDFMGVGREIELDGDSLAQIAKILSAYKMAKDDPIVHKMMGRKMAVALMPPQVGQPPIADITEFLEYNTILITQPENPRTWLAKISGIPENDGNLSSTQYGNHQIYRIRLGQHTVSLVFLDSFAVASVNEQHVRRSIDTFDGELSPLSSEADFQDIRKEFNAPGTFIYVPLKTMRRFLSSVGMDARFPTKDLLLRGLQSTAGFNGLGYVAWRKKEKIEKKMFLRFEREEVSPFAIKYVETRPVKSSMLSFSTSDPMVYYWSNTLNFKNFSIYIEDGAEQDPRLAEFLKQLKATTGKDAAAMFSLFGQEASLIVEQGPPDALFPFPLGIFFIRMENPAEFRAVMEKLLQAYHLPLTEGRYGSAWFRYWEKGPQDGLLPLYGFCQGYFFFGNSLELLRRVADNHDRRVFLTDIGDIKKIDPGMGGKNNSVTYLNNVQLITTAENFLEVLGTFIAIENRTTAMKVRIFLKKIVNPLLDGARMYRASASCSRISNHLLTIDSITDISDKSPRPMRK